ncbi:MAG: GIY-YIG nuclease family protein [Bacteroidota bacterium]
MSRRCVYVGDASNLRRRIRQHQRGNVEASALRKHVAKALGYSLARTRRASGGTRVRIDAPDPKAAEARVSAYLASGTWRWVACASKEEARALQWHAIALLDPLLNRDRREPALSAALDAKAAQLAAATPSGESVEGPGVYALFHMQPPGAE